MLEIIDRMGLSPLVEVSLDRLCPLRIHLAGVIDTLAQALVAEVLTKLRALGVLDHFLCQVWWDEEHPGHGPEDHIAEHGGCANAAKGTFPCRPPG